MNGKVYIAGGCQDPTAALSTCEVYNPLTNEWQLMPSLKVPQMSVKAWCAMMDSCMFWEVSNNSSWVLLVEIFESEQNEWKEKSVIPVDCFETSQEKKERNRFKACFTTLCKEVIDKLMPL